MGAEEAVVDFEFQNATRIIFGRGVEARVGAEAVRHGRKVLLHYGGGSIRQSGLYDRVRRSLAEAGLQVVELGGVVPNPRLALVREGIRLCREQGVDSILAVGGGSVIDSAKAIGIGVPYPGDVWDFFTTRKGQVQEMLPVGVVLTIPAAGSEASNGCVITREEDRHKTDAGGECMRPRYAVLNPELTFTLPPYQTAAGAADIMAHVMERYFTNVPAVDFTDRLGEATLQTVIRHVPAALENPRDYDARAQIMWASTIAHNDLLGTGRVGDWASHQIEHELSALYDVAHGAGLAVVFPAWMRHVVRHDVARFARFAVRVWGVEADFGSPERTALEGIRRLKAFLRGIGMPVTLGELGVPADRLAEMASRCTARGPVGSFVKLGEAEVLEIYRLAA
jgi:alcohol dehydrogenase YqhD (iron-dependent ADH family)